MIFKAAKTIVIMFFLIGVLNSAYTQLVNYVDPFIGVRDDASNCVIGPQLPWGSINPSPNTKNGSQDGYSPNEPIRGFSQLHVSGTGWGKYAQVLLSPQIGLAVGLEDHDSEKSNEIAKAYEYSVMLDRYKIKTDVTPSKHSAIYCFTFPKSNDSHIVVDISHTIADIVPKMTGGILQGELNIVGVNNNEIKGYGKYVGGFGGSPYDIHFVIKISDVPKSFGTFKNGVINNSSSQLTVAKDDRSGCFFRFATSNHQKIYLKVAVSFKSIQQAEYWLNNEIPAFDYNLVKNNAIESWNKQLSKIQISSDNTIEKSIFYTALYHSMLMPRDRTNDSNDFDKDVPVWDDHFTVWDTWRTLYPLYCLIAPDVVSGTINSFIARYNKNNMVKDAYISMKEMIEEQGGNNIDNIIADAYVKGIKGVDWDKAYEVVKHNAENERAGSWAWNKQDSTNTYKELGWIVKGRMSNSMTLEYAYNDYCVAQLAKGLGKSKDFRKYLKRSGNWLNLWNKDAESDGFRGFIDSRNAKGDFCGIDYKMDFGSWNDHFYEGSSWTYSWFVPHQFTQLVMLNGGKEEMARKLKYGFDNELIDYGNEPSFLSVFGFHYCDRPDLANFYVNKLRTERFTTIGYSGNEDSGAMSSWYIFSSLGIFPNAGQTKYYLTGPKFKEATINLENSKKIVIKAPNISKENIYVKNVYLNGRKVNANWIYHKDIKDGAELVFEMSNKPK